MLHRVGAKKSEKVTDCQKLPDKLFLSFKTQNIIVFLFVVQVFNFCSTQASPYLPQNCKRVGHCSRCSISPDYRLNPDEISLDISRIRQSIQRDITGLRALFGFTERRLAMEGFSVLKIREKSLQAAASTATSCLNFLDKFYQNLRQHAGKLQHRRHEVRQLRISSKAFSIKNIIMDGRVFLNHMCFCDLQNVPILPKSTKPSFDVASKVLEILDRSLTRLCTTTTL
ncbi:uncharacterized protein LOC120348322 [Styela clava]|uniref:uncharacterized protein LOC120348322 n=1 Tax=Styela clava TaxID=7725 RepID=UPI00193AB6B2|nr:uncharacterized protein LOC120348322 [Styela clava]